MADGDLTAEQQVRIVLIKALSFIESTVPFTAQARDIHAEIREAIKRMDEAGAA